MTGCAHIQNVMFRKRPKVGLAREAAIRPVAKQLVAAVQHLHEHCIAHRDLSCENLLIHKGSGEGPAMSKHALDISTLCTLMCPLGASHQA
eukprot:5493829-Amphidinium_carterae.2